MTDAVIRPGNGLMLMALQSAEGTAATPAAATDVVPYETDSLSFGDPFKMEASNESTGGFAAGAPLVMYQPITISFRSRLKGIGAGGPYTSTAKPPLHAALSACGWLGVFTAAVVAAALTAGTATSATLGTGGAATAQAYRGMPLVLTGAPAAGRTPLILDYTASKVALLADQFGSALSTSNTAAIPANWTYAPTSPLDATSRGTMHPTATMYIYQDGRLYQFVDCRGTVDFDGSTSGPGFASFTFSGIYAGVSDAAVPSNPVFPTQSAPLLVQGAGTQPAFQINRRGLPISKWSLKYGGSIETPDDPNTSTGFGAGQIADRAIQLEIDPLRSLVATRNALTDIAAFSQYGGGWMMGSTANNRVSFTLPLIQPTDSAATMRGKLQAETLHYAVMSPGRDNANRDGDCILCFS